MTAKQSETAEALKRLNGNYIYFKPKRYLNKRGSIVKMALTALILPIRMGMDDRVAPKMHMRLRRGWKFVEAIKHDPDLGKHVAGKDQIGDSGWHRLVWNGYFDEASPEMKLYLHDVKLKEAYQTTQREQRISNDKHQQATSRVRDLNRKIGKRGTAR